MIVKLLSFFFSFSLSVSLPVNSASFPSGDIFQREKVLFFSGVVIPQKRGIFPCNTFVTWPHETKMLHFTLPKGDILLKGQHVRGINHRFIDTYGRELFSCTGIARKEERLCMSVQACIRGPGFCKHAFSHPHIVSIARYR